MKRMLARFYIKQLPIYFIVTMIANFIIAGSASAMFVPAAPQTQAAPLYDRAADLAKIQRVLESKTLQKRLMDYGLSPGIAYAKINGLSDEQVHQFAARIDALQAGGMSDSSLIIILLLVILIIIII
jgi:hypothetical protein